MLRSSTRGVDLFLGLFIVVGLAAIGASIWTSIRGIRCSYWPVTEAIIDAAEMKAHSSNKGTSYSPSVSYRYRVGDVTYSGDRLSFGQMSSSPAYAQRVLARYPVGKKVPVHYLPDDPQTAVLETGLHGGIWVGFGVGTVFVLVGVMFLQLMRRANATVVPASPPSAEAGQPPKLMGVVLIVMGSFAFFAEPSTGTPRWIPYAAGGVFVLFGLFLLAHRLHNKIYSDILKWAAVLAFAAIFHWVAFGGGERIGTSTTPFSHKTGLDVRMPFIVFTVVLDALCLAFGIRWLVKRTKE